MLKDKKILVICGPSSSGKSTLEENLVKEYPELFHKLQQASTRRMREGESFGRPYIFMQDECFELFKPNLIGKLGIVEDSLFKDKYGKQNCHFM